MELTPPGFHTLSTVPLVSEIILQMKSNRVALQQKLETLAKRFCCGGFLVDDNHPLSTVLLQKQLAQEVVLSWVLRIKNIELYDLYILVAPLENTGNSQPPSRQLLATWVIKSQGMGHDSSKAGEETMDRFWRHSGKDLSYTALK